MKQDTGIQLKEQVEKELRNNILKFWCEYAPDNENGGFYGFISKDLEVNDHHDKASVLNARILWTYSKAYRLYKQKSFLDMAVRAYEYIRKHFINYETMGVYWLLDYKGKPVDTKNQVYANAFTIYALSEYFRAAGDKSALDLAVKLFEALEEHARDKAHGGYLEAFAADWSPLSDMSLSEKDMNVPKSMNTHLHVLEAYTNLLRVWDSDKLKASLDALLKNVLEHIVDKNSWRFELFFSLDWTPCSDITSFGHDIEGSWLIYEAAEVLGDGMMLEKARTASIRMAEKALLNGMDEEFGGMYNELHDTKLDDNKDWWPQAEAVVGFFNAWQLTGDRNFLDASYKCWQFIDKYIVDPKNGEWHWGVTRDGSRVTSSEKAGQWKCPYHNSRMCYEIISRVK